jgi:metallo-beta-lactamase class B
MNTPTRVAAAIALCACLSHATAADWYAPQDPFAIADGTYYVGTGGISAVLITSPAGHILIDAGPTGADGQVAAHIRQLGFKVEDIRIILNSHDHFDHAGGIAAMQKASGAAVLASPPALAVLRSGLPDKSDPQFPSLEPMAPAAGVRPLRNGEVVRVGTLAVTAHFTPGHTKGGTSWTWEARSDGKTVHLVYADSLTAIAAKGRRFDGNPLYPEARADLERSIALVEALPCDVLVSTHPEASGLWERKAQQPVRGVAAFVDPAACRRYAAKARAWLADTLATEARDGAGAP